MSELHMYYFYFFSIRACTFSTCSFVVFILAAVAELLRVWKKSIFYFMDIMYKHIFLNFGVMYFIYVVMLGIIHTCTALRYKTAFIATPLSV